MRASLLAGASAAALIGVPTAAMSADLPVYLAPIVSPALVAFNWTGAYGGLHAGLGFGHDSDEDICDLLAAGLDRDGSALSAEDLECETANTNLGEIPRFVDLTGAIGDDKVGVAFTEPEEDDDHLSWLAGGQVGYNWQRGRAVFGLEADLSLAHMSEEKSHAFDVYDKTGAFFETEYAGSGQIEEELDLNWMATLRGRAGVALGGEGRLLLYGTAGIALAQIDTSLTGSMDPDLSCDECGFLEDDNDHDLKIGYALGVGTEYAFTDRFSLGLEYLYANFGEEEERLTFNGPSESELTFEREFDLDWHFVRLKGNYRF